MKKLSLILGILIFLDTFYFIYVNSGQSYTFTYPPIIKELTLGSGLSLLMISLYSALGTFLIVNYFILNLKDNLKKQIRNTEKSSIRVEESSDKVKALQAKIDTLEIALKEALSKK